MKNLFPFRLFFNIALFTYVSIKTTFPDLADTKLAFLSIPFNSEVNLIRKTYGLSDAGSYLDIAISLASFNNIQPEQYFFIHTWPPGQSIILALAILASKVLFSLYLFIYLINYVIWIAIIFFLTKQLSSLTQLIVFYIFFVTFLISTDFTYYFYTYIFHSENIGNSLLFFALLLLSWLIKNKIQNRSRYVIAGLLLGFSTLIRYTSETGIFLLLLLLLILLILHRYLPALFNSRIKNGQMGNIKILRLTFLSILIALITTVPWRVLNIAIYDMDTIRLSNASSWTIYGAWAAEKSPEAEYWSANGMNWACKIDPLKCDYLNNLGLKSFTPQTVGREALKSAIIHPKSYVTERFKYFQIHYFEGGGLSIKEYRKFFSLAAVIGCLYLLTLFGSRKFWYFDNALISLVWTSFIFNQLLMYAITHYEYRYFIIFKFLIFGYIMSLVFQSKKPKEVSPH